MFKIFPAQQGEVMGKSYSMTFFGKVMSFFALAIFMSMAGTFIATKYLLFYFVSTPALMPVLFITELVIIFTARIWKRHSPLNKIMFVVFTFITGITLAPIIAVVAASPFGLSILIRALLATALMFSAAAVFGYTTKVNLVGMRGFLLLSLVGMIIVGILGIFIPWGSAGEMMYSGFGIVLFSGFVMYDFQKLKRYPENMYIEAALDLYLDIFNLFIYILRFIGAQRN